MLLPFLAFNLTMNMGGYVRADEIKKDLQTLKFEKSISSEKAPVQDSNFVSDAWDELVGQLKTAKLRTKINGPTADIAKGLGFSSDYAIESKLSIGGKYSGIDIWDMNISASPELFGITNNSGIGVGISTSRQVTFIQQFNSRLESLMRLPYDPITKLPVHASIFDKKTYNVLTKKSELVIKEGDFIGLRAPLTLSLGKGFGERAAHLGFEANLFWVLGGEFDVHIFRMANNQVRVKIMAIKDDIKGGSIGLGLMGFNGFGEIIINRLIDTNLLKLTITKSDSDLFIADYIFNLNNAESRDMYDHLLSHKIKFLDLKALANHLKTANPFIKDSTTKEYLIGDLEPLNIASEADQNKPVAERRIIRVSSGKNNTASVSSGMKLNIFKLMKANSSMTKATSKATLDGYEDYKKEDKYILETRTANKSYELFNFWGAKEVLTTSLLFKTDDKFNPERIMGLQLTKSRQDMSMTESEYLALQRRYEKVLPQALTSYIQWPKWDFSEKSSAQNVFVQYELMFTENLFKVDLKLNAAMIRNELVNLLNSGMILKSMPINLPSETSMMRDQDSRFKAFKKNDYVNAYLSELSLIPNKLALALDKSAPLDVRHKAYLDLDQTTELFNEIREVLLLKLIPANLLPDVVLAKLALSAKKQEGAELYFPSKSVYDRNNSFREITYQTQYILNRSFDLRNYIKEDGSFYTAEEVLSQRTAK